MIRFGADAARIDLGGTLGDGRIETRVVLTRRDSRRLDLNGERLASSERLRHELATLVFTPDRLAVVKGAPTIRRAYLDRVAGRLFPARATLSSEYASALGQRNAGLRRVRAGLSTRSALEPWSESVAALGRDLVDVRREALETLSEPFARMAYELGLAGATLGYEGDQLTVADLDARLDSDIERGVTGAGPHLHDVRIVASDRDLRGFGSQGEQRIAVLALVLAEAETLRERHRTTPLVLLDDVLSELDGDRRSALARMLTRGSQTVVTATTEAAFPGVPAQTLTVAPGEVR
jgi:DNA replication and repair protein RecF